MAKMKDLMPQKHDDYPGEDIFIFEHPEYHIEVVKTKAKQFCMECNELRDPDVEGEKCECEGDELPEIYLRSIFEFTATSGEIVEAFNCYCKNKGIKNPFTSASVFGERFKNDRHLLEKAGWMLKTRNDETPYFKTIRGQNYYRLQKEIIR
jgi:molybdenum cofactor biosynthesis enzyme MoaA